jgi:hypothetical protein
MPTKPVTNKRRPKVAIEIQADAEEKQKSRDRTMRLLEVLRNSTIPVKIEEDKAAAKKYPGLGAIRIELGPDEVEYVWTGVKTNGN